MSFINNNNNSRVQTYFIKHGILFYLFVDQPMPKDHDELMKLLLVSRHGNPGDDQGHVQEQMTQNPAETDPAEAETECAQWVLWDIITHQGTRKVAVSKYKDELVNLMDKLVDVAKNAHTLELEGIYWKRMLYLPMICWMQLMQCKSNVST